MDDLDFCYRKGSTSVLPSATLIARRKRMEITKFKKLTRCMPFPYDLFPVPESSNVCMKRARIERAATTGSVFDDFDINATILSQWRDTDAATDSRLKGEETVRTNDFGLLRYRSLPLRNVPCSYTICDPADGMGTGLQSPLHEEQPCNSPNISSEVDDSESHPSFGESVRDALDDGASLSMEVDSESLQLGKPDAVVTSNPSSEITLTKEPVTSDLMLRRLDPELGDNSTCTQNTVSSQGEDIAPEMCPELSICPHSGKLLVCGRRREMEDMSTIAPSFAQIDRRISEACLCSKKIEEQPACDMHFFAVYDGHGGSQASTYCMERLHHALAEEVSSLSSANDGDLHALYGSPKSSTWEKVMETCFLKVDREVGGVCPNDEPCDGASACCSDSIAPENVGTTAVVAVVSACQIVVANCGDSRAVLSRGGVAVPLSRDHKPDRDDETSRIEAAGGHVIYWDGYRVGGLLALSRSIGDRYLKQFVVSEPEVTRVQRTDDDECLILASDGLWDVVSNDTACHIARKCLASSRKKRAAGSIPIGADPASNSVAALLVKLAYGRGSKDNISVVVIDLKS